MWVDFLTVATNQWNNILNMLPIQVSVSLPSSYLFFKTKDTVIGALIVYNLISTNLTNIYLFSAYYVPATLPGA